MIVLLLIIVISLLCSMAIIITSEVHEKDTSGMFYPRMWCHKYGLKFREAAFGNSLGVVVDATMWYGEDSDGRRFVPDRNGMPVLLDEEGGAK